MRPSHVAIAGFFLLLPVLSGGDLRIRRNGAITDIDVGASSSARHTIRFALVQEQPSTVTVTIRKGGSSGSLTLDPRSAARPQALRVPSGEYELVFEAPHHRTVHRAVKISDADLDLGKVNLLRYPVLSGSVKAKDGSPVAGAVITATKLLTKSDTLGRYELEVAGDWPAQLEISYPGLATTQAAVPKAERSAELPAVTLSKASRITVEIGSLDGDADVDLARETGINRIEIVKTRHATASSPRAIFDDIAAGSYFAVVRGKGPLQRLAVPVRASEAEPVSRAVHIEPIALEIEVRRGDAAAGGALVTVQSDGNRWASTLRADAAGRVAAEAWERGDFLFAVQASENSPPSLIPHPIEGVDQATIRLELPDRVIAGRVVDAESGAAVASANVRIESVNDDGTGGTMSTTAGTDGTFRLEGLRDGTHTLVVEMESYLPSEPDVIRLDQAAQHRELTVRLSQGLARRIRIMSAQGLPVARAIIVSSVAGRVTGVTKSDDSGAATLRVPPGGAAAAFIIPAEGSFAVARLDGKPTDREETVIVPAGNASLEVRTIDSDGKPVPDVYFAMRYDGEVIPADVAQVLERRRGIRPSSSADGVARLDGLPTGFLELWPIRTTREFEQLLATGAKAPVQVALKEGKNVATLTFVRKR